MMTNEHVKQIAGIVADIINSELRTDKVVATGSLDLLTEDAFIVVSLIDKPKGLSTFDCPKGEPYYSAWDDGEQIKILFNTRKLAIDKMAEIYLTTYNSIYRKKLSNRKPVIKYEYN